MKMRVLKAAAAVALVFSTAAQAGPVIIDGTDANDHGTVSAGVNLQGWEYMQRALENLAAQVSGSVTKVVTVLGTGANVGQAGTAIQSAFALSSLASSGWTINYVNGAAAIGTALGSLSTSTTGILYMTTCGNSGGDMDATELAAVNANAAAIANFVGGAGNAALGGALWTMGQSCTGAYNWLTSVIPGLVAVDVGGGGVGTNITLTADGATAFPGLSNADLAGADPWHGYFTGNLGSLKVLGTAQQGSFTRNVIIGGGVGTTISNSVPEPGTLALLGLGLAGLAALRRRRA